MNSDKINSMSLTSLITTGRHKFDVRGLVFANLTQWHRRAGQWLLFNLLLSGLVTSIIFIIVAGMWFEFSQGSGDVFFDADFINGQQTLLSIITSSAEVNIEQVLVVFSSRDNQSLVALFLFWRMSFYGVLMVSYCWLMMQLHKHKIILFWMVAPLMALCFVIVGGQLTEQRLPVQFNMMYLVQIFVIGLLTLTVYLAIYYLQKCNTLTPTSNTLIAYASQSGTAKNVALSMVRSSQSRCDIRDFSQLTPQCLLGYNQLFVVASTYGNGQAPEKSVGFSQALISWQQQLSHLNYAVLALGDRAYPQYCAFGHQIASLLSEKGAISIHPVQEVDRGDASVIGHWWQKIGVLFGWKHIDITQEWLDGVIVSNDCLNPQQVNRPAHVITIIVDNASYQAGDLLEVLTPMLLVAINEKLLKLGLAPQTVVTFNGEQCSLNKALAQLEWTNQVANSAQALVDKLPRLRPRVYSIASAPNGNTSHKNKVRLLVRELKKDDGSVGFSSSALCNAVIEQSFKVAVRTHDSFRLPSKNTPIIMIAAGTGIAPFMSFLTERHQQGSKDNWLMFGEQYSSHDNYFNNELDDHLESGTLSRLDCAFSRDETWLKFGKPRYVGDVIIQQSNQLTYWLLNQGAHLYVCGNKAGMGDSVKTALRKVLNEDYDKLQQADKLHFDLY